MVGGPGDPPLASPPGASRGEGGSQPSVLNRLWSPWEPGGRGTFPPIVYEGSFFFFFLLILSNIC